MKPTRLQTTTSIGMAALGMAIFPVLPLQTVDAAPSPAGAATDAAQSATADIYIIQVSGRG